MSYRQLDRSAAEDLRLLSVWQPWAWLIVHGPKDVENRRRCWSYRGRVLIHASMRLDQRGIELLQDRGIALPDRFDFGGVVGRARIVDCVETSSSPWFFGPVGLVLEDRAPLPFFECRGYLGLTRPKPQILAFYQGKL